MNLSSTLVNLASQAEPAIIMIQGIAGLIALFLFAGGLTDIWSAGNANSQKFLAGGQRSSISAAVVQLFIAILFLAVADLQLIGMASRSLTGTYAASRMTSSSFSYARGPTGSNSTELAVFAIIALLQVIGIIAFMKGLFVINGKVKGTSQSGYGTGLCFLIGGLGCWNSIYVAHIFNNTLGFNIFGLFGLSSSP
ncbi:MAG: hypothetical protein LBE22_03765 [Azoarcus sp.]|jgi:intracellular multiplication protein IcmC|nr:hypothetical protein [Azoarcus sp.]